MAKSIEQISKTAVFPSKSMRVASRALIFKDNKILLSYEKNNDVYMTPGGGIEENETLQECCAREVQEETGYKIDVGDFLYTVNEYVYSDLFICNYFKCDIIGECKNSLTELEISRGLEPRWVDINEAKNIFSQYEKYPPNTESLYLREYTILKDLF